MSEEDVSGEGRAASHKVLLGQGAQLLSRQLEV